MNESRISYHPNKPENRGKGGPFVIVEQAFFSITVGSAPPGRERERGRGSGCHDKAVNAETDIEIDKQQMSSVRRGEMNPESKQALKRTPQISCT